MPASFIVLCTSKLYGDSSDVTFSFSTVTSLGDLAKIKSLSGQKVPQVCQPLHRRLLDQQWLGEYLVTSPREDVNQPFHA